MAQSLSRVFVHITFSTKNRHPFIDERVQNDLWEYMGGICRGLECTPIQIGGHYDHTHILCLLSRKIAQMKLLEEVKKISSAWMKTKGELYENFYWQDGYGILSVNPSEFETVVRYINNQSEHHKNYTFKEELLAFLKKYNMEYNEQYLWD